MTSTLRRPWLGASVVVPTLVVAVASIVIVFLGLRGADYPTHYFRAELWRQTGFATWDTYWYAGHSTPSYSIVVPPIVAAIDPAVVCAIAAVVSTWLFCDLHRRLVALPSMWWGNAVFAGIAIDNVIVGRTAYMVGFAVATGSVWAWYRGRRVAAVVLAMLSTLASPVAGVFLGLIAAGAFVDGCLTWWAARSIRERGSDGWSNLARDVAMPVAIGVACAVPMVVIAVRYGSEGSFTFPVAQFVLSLVILLATASIMQERIARCVLVVAAAACVVFFVVPNALAGNFVRFAYFVVVPVAVGQLARAWASQRARAAVVAIAVASACFWVGQFTVRTVARWATDPSTDEEFFAPLLAELTARNADAAPIGRVEIPFTTDHWEAYHVAVSVPYARGWERQVDVDRNEVLYDTDLDWPTYSAWLADNGVRWIATPTDSVPIDQGGRPEVALIESGAADEGLTTVWSSDDWTLYEVDGYTPIVDPPATLVDQSPDTITISTPEAGDVVVRYRHTDRMQIDGGATLRPTADGWLIVTLPDPGDYTLHVPAP